MQQLKTDSDSRLSSTIETLDLALYAERQAHSATSLKKVP